jgi:hypothetical protein
MLAPTRSLPVDVVVSNCTIAKIPLTMQAADNSLVIAIKAGE